MASTDFTYMPEEEGHKHDIELLNKQAFGPARFTRASFFVREGGGHDLALSFIGCLEQFPKSVTRFSDKNCGKNKELEQFVELSETKTALDGRIAGSVRQSLIAIGSHQALLLGPLVVGGHYKNVGLGAGLMNKALEAAREKKHRLILLVGDMSYYGRFGFIVADSHQILMPAPVNPKRLLVCELVPNALKNISGPVRHQACVKNVYSERT